MGQSNPMEAGCVALSVASARSSLEESITLSLEVSSSTLIPTGDCFTRRGAFVFFMAGLEIHLLARRVEA